MTRENCLKKIYGFESYLRNEEKSAATIEKYLRDVRSFLSFLSGGRRTSSLERNTLCGIRITFPIKTMSRQA